MTKPLSNKDIFNELSKKVIGHDHAKKVLINIINRSKLRYYQRWGDPTGMPHEDEILQLSNCLLIGDSGTGKTYLVETLSKIMEFPYLKIDATELNPTGASEGIKKKDLIRKITRKAEEMMELNPRKYFSLDGTLDQTVVFIDEIDKLAGEFSTGKWNAHVQSNFLTLFENKDEGLEGVTFIFAGAFTGLDKYNEIQYRKRVGFHSDHSEEEKTGKSSGELAQEITSFGLLPEIVGRLQHIVLLDQLTEDTYKTILLDTLMPKVINDLRIFGVKNFKLSQEKQDELINSAMDSGLGVRHLQTELSRLLVDIEFEHEMKFFL